MAGVPTPRVRFAWEAVRLPILAFLRTLMPLVEFSLSVLAFFGVLIALLFKFLGLPHFPFWGMLGFSIGCALLLMACQALTRLFSR